VGTGGGEMLGNSERAGVGHGGKSITAGETAVSRMSGS
jgi:hypothetical protein